MKPAVIIAVIIGLLFCAIAVLYWIEPASALPGFFPGHAIGSTQHHTKHGVFALALAIVSFIAAWFLSGPKQEAA